MAGPLHSTHVLCGWGIEFDGCPFWKLRPRLSPLQGAFVADDKVGPTFSFDHLHFT